MPLWGKTDNLAGKPKFVTRKAFFAATAVDDTDDTIDLTAANTGFSTGDEVVYSINGGTVIAGLTDGATYYVRATAAGTIALYDTYAHAIDTEATTGLVDITDVGVGTHTLQRTGAANVNDHNFNGQALYFVDREESQQVENRARGLISPGWWLYKTYTDVNSRVRHKAELLVAIDVPTATSGDASDDSVLVDRTITISVQPADITVAEGETAEFSVTAAASPTAVLTYQWQKQEGGAGSWSNISGATSASYTTGVTVLADDDGDAYRVVVSSSGATSVTSSAATLTVE